ncbi:Pentatricopeptide repeat-containing protein At5g39350 [Linum perenne]
MHGLGRGALKLLQDMNWLGVSVDSITFTSVLSACHHSGLVEEGLELFESMTREYGFITRMEHYSCVVNMPARAVACLDQQNVEVGKLASEQLVHLEPHRAGHYVTLSNMYDEAGNWYDAIRILMMKEELGQNPALKNVN